MTDIYSQTNSSGIIGAFISNITAMGYNVAADSDLIGKTIGTISFAMKRQGSAAAATFSFQVYNSSGTLQYTFGTLDTDEITSGSTNVYTKSGSYTIAEGDRIVLHCSNPGTGSGADSVVFNGTSPNTNSGSPHYVENVRQDGSGWHDDYSDEMPYMVLTEGTAGTGTRLPPPPLIARF